MVECKTLNEWLIYIKASHHQEIDLSLERVVNIGTKLDVLHPQCSVITVAGTNGKGSCVAGLEAIYLEAGFKVGAFTTPFFWKYNEQVRLQGKCVDDAMFCDAFARIAAVCGDEVSLTLFEYGTLAACIIFKEANLDVWLLEVGLGGRWDAVNAIDADVSVVTSIALDHMDWLGDTREKIALEKSGIFRAHKLAVCGDLDPPFTLIDYASTIGTRLFCQHRDFGWNIQPLSWSWWSQTTELNNLPMSLLALQNMSTVLMVVDLLQSVLPVHRNAIHNALSEVTLPGRIEVISGDVEQIFDVSHNPAAVEMLNYYVKSHPVLGKTYAVFSMLRDKDILTTIESIKGCIDEWHVAPVISERSATSELLHNKFQQANVEPVLFYLSIKEAYTSVMHRAVKGDRVLVFGSFRTVAEARYGDITSVKVSEITF